MALKSTLTTTPVEPGTTAGGMAEFGRWQDVQRAFGIKRGSLYNLLRDGRIKGVLLRVCGQKSGLRLIHMQSVRDYILSQMDEAARGGGQ